MTSRLAVDRRSQVPLYHQLKDYLSTKIVADELQPGDPMPSEAQLAAQFSVSRITVRQAMTRLEFEGLIERRQGKGTFVSRPKLVHRDRLLKSLEEEIRAQGRSPAFHFIDFIEVAPSPKVQRELCSAREERVCLLRRLKLVDGEPLAIETRFFPARVGKKFDRTSLGRLPIYQLIETAIGHFPKHLVETISCSASTEDESRDLQVPVGYPVLVGDHTMFDDDESPVECGKTIFRGDRYQIHLESWRGR
jgi:GntR family transcriptional regulator